MHLTCSSAITLATQVLVSRIISHIHIRVINACATRGHLHVGHLAFPCLLGRSGITRRKREGDGATPAGRWGMLEFLERRDRQRPVTSILKRRAIKPQDGWCDAASDRNYNRAVTLPYPASHEQLMRKDEAYDTVVILDCNIWPRKRGGGSAIFFHLTRAGVFHTEGCIAVSAKHMRQILAMCGPHTRMIIE
jgi:L,D-peptidoglycan transpeptidase YkuD (ErfK/YbiS/YcfS/YnhG family)